MPDTITLTRDPGDPGYEIPAGENGRVYVITYPERLVDADGNEVMKGLPHRRPIEPDADTKDEPAEVKALAELVRTPERLARHEAALVARLANVQVVLE